MDNARRRSASGAILLILTLGGGGLLPAPHVAADVVIVVDTGEDALVGASDGLCSLREAIVNASADQVVAADCPAGDGFDQIVFAEDVADIVLTQPQLGENGGRSGDLDITGGGVEIDGGGRVTIRPGPGFNDRAFDVRSASLHLMGLSIIGFDAQPFVDSGDGAAIRVLSDRLSLEGSSLLSNNAAGSGGAIAILGNAVVEIRGSTLARNSAAVAGGALHLGPTAGSVLTSNVTISSNSAARGAGIDIDPAHAGSVYVDATTIADNIGSGIEATHGAVTTVNSIIANRSGGPQIPDCTAPLTTDGPSLDSDGSCEVSLTGEPGLGPLEDASTFLIHRPLPSSLVVGRGMTCASVDQIGTLRPSDGCELGSLELPPIAAGPRSQLRSVADRLRAAFGTQATDRIAKAIRELDDADARRWDTRATADIGDDRLGEDGQKVFDDVRHAVSELGKSRGDLAGSASADLTATMAAIATGATAQARALLNTADCARVDCTKARKDVERAETDISDARGREAEDADKAIADLRKAYEASMRAQETLDG